MVNSNLDIIFLGDSLTSGYGVNNSDCWVNKLTLNKNLNSLNKSKNGDTTASMLCRYYNDVIKNCPKIIFIMAGTNDLLCNRKIKFIVENIKLMIIDGLNLNSKLIIGIPPKILKSMAKEVFCDDSSYNYAESHLQVLKNELLLLCDFYNIPYINFYDLPFDDNSFFIDGIHLSSKGHDYMFVESSKLF